MKKILMVLLFAAAMVAAPAVSDTLTDYEYNRISFGNAYTNDLVKPIIRNADRSFTAPVANVTLLAAIDSDSRYQGMMVNVDTGMYFYDATDCGIGATSPTAVAPDDAVGCWYLISGAADIWAALAATTATSGATLVGIYDVATYFTGTTVEAALAELGLFDTNLGLLTTGNGASMIGVEDAATYFTGEDVEAVLREIGLFDASLALTTTGNGASLIGVEDSADYFTATTVEGVEQELGAFDDSLSLTTTGNGASLIGVEDSTGYFTGENVEAVLSEIGLEFTTTMPVIGTPSTGYFPTITALGTLENSAYQPSDFARASDVVAAFAGRGLHVIVDEAVDGGSVPAEPADGYRVFCTGDGGAFTEGYIYEYTTGTGYDAGTLLGDGETVAVKGTEPDYIVGGVGTTDYNQLTEKLDADLLACVEVTITNPAESATSGADADWVGATVTGIVPVSGCDQPVTGHSVAGDGAVTISLAATPTTACVIKACGLLL